jgi:hypothetical protein
MENMKLGDPLLLVDWNIERLNQMQENDPAHCKRVLVDTIVNNGAVNELGSDCILSFRDIRIFNVAEITCRHGVYLLNHCFLNSLEYLLFPQWESAS